VAAEDGPGAWHYWTFSARPFLMLDVFDYLLRSFNDTTAWNEDNFYSNLTAVSRSLPPARPPSLFSMFLSSNGR
jgi:hypothetical protein